MEQYNLPTGATQKDLDAFLKNYMNNLEAVPIKTEKEDRTCATCGHWNPTGKYCIVSCTCPTQIFNKKPPTRWMSKIVFEEFLNKPWIKAQKEKS